MSNRKLFPESVTSLPDPTSLTSHGLMVHSAEPEHQPEPMTILFSLAIPDPARAQLEEKVARGEVIPPDELQRTYAASPADTEALKNWLKSQGFEILHVSPDGIYARGTAQEIEKSLQ